jgi:hypothetical protein
LITGRQPDTSGAKYPTALHYLRKAYGDAASNYWFITGAHAYRQWRHNTDSLGGLLPGYGVDTSPVVLSASRVYSPGLTTRETRNLEQFVDATRKARLWELDLKNFPIPRLPFIGDSAGLALVPRVLKEFKPRMMICQIVGHDAGHGSGGYARRETGYSEYLQVCRTTDELLGRLFDFIINDPYFSKTTAIVVRPEFGRDDEINRHGEINHSDGYYQSIRSAEIWWGPDFRVGVDRSVKNRRDMVPSIARVFNVDATYATGRPHLEMFR